MLHHAFTYGTDSCFYLIASHAQLLYNLHITFPEDLLDAYGTVLDWLYEQTLEQFYEPGNGVPDVSPLVMDEFNNNKKLKGVNMTEHTF